MNIASIKKLKKITIEDLFILIIVSYAILSNDLAFFRVKYHSNVNYINIAISIITYIIMLYFILIKRKISKCNFIIAMLPFVWFILIVCNTYGGYKGNGILGFVLLLTFALLDNSIKRKIFKMYFRIIIITTIISIIICLFFYLGIDIGQVKVEYYVNSYRFNDVYYIKYGPFAMLSSYNVKRLCSIFNEPGNLGTLLAFLYVATYSYSKKWEKVVMIIAEIFTFSVAGYILIMIFYIFYIFLKDKKNIIYILFILILFFVLPKIDWKNPTLQYTFHRISLSELKNNNRTNDEFDNVYNEFKSSEKKYLGYGYKYPFNISKGFATYKEYIVWFGYIGFLILFSLWIFFSYIRTENDKYALLLIIIFFISIYQRPWAILNLYGYIVLFGGIESIKYMNRQ